MIEDRAIPKTLFGPSLPPAQGALGTGRPVEESSPMTGGVAGVHEKQTRRRGGGGGGARDGEEEEGGGGGWGGQSQGGK